MDTMEWIKNKGKCCITEKPLLDSEHVNLIQLGYKAEWPAPVAGNVLTGTSGIAVAVVHDDCITPNGTLTDKVRFAIEFKDNTIIYHAVNTLQPLD